MGRKKVLVIGFDSGTPELVRRWAAEGRLPTLKAFIEEGASGPLASTLPPQSPAAWSTFATGWNPGRHGILNFVQLSADSYDPVFVNATHRRGTPFWARAGRHGIRGGVLNVPLTYPPSPYNGFVVGGMLSPSVGPAMCCPSEVYEDLADAAPDYPVDVEIPGREKTGAAKLFLQRAHEAVEARTRAALALYRKHDPDLFCVVFTAPDRVSHYFWPWGPDGTEASGAAPPPEGAANAVRDIYAHVDQAIGRVLEEVGAADVIVLSDHGATGLRRMFNLRRLLLREDLLVRKRRGAFRSAFHRLLFGLNDALPNWLKARVKARLPGLSSQVAGEVALEGTDFAASRAYPALAVPGAYVNLRGRQPCGIVEPGSEYESVRDELIRIFQEVRDPESGRPVFARAYRREELWDGPRLPRLPDVVLEQRDWSYDTRLKTAGRSGRLFAPLLSSRRDGLYYRAHHSRRGLLLAAGSRVRNVRLQSAQIADVPATILALLGCPVPDHFDGRVLTEMLADGVTVEGGGSEEDTPDGEAEEFSAEEREAVQKRLKDLGYL